MKLLVTGSDGFIGKNLIAALNYLDEPVTVLACNRRTQAAELERFVGQCDFVFHLAGVNRAERDEDFWEGNQAFTARLLEMLQNCGSRAGIVAASSVQARDGDTPYARSKRAVERLLLAYGERNGLQAVPYRLPNVYGKWCRPNYNSAIATFCYNTARGLPIQVHEPDREMTLAYIDDVVASFLAAMHGGARREDGFGLLDRQTVISLGEAAALIQGFPEYRRSLGLPNLTRYIEKTLYSTYISYLPEDDFFYPLTTHRDERGSFTELFRSPASGQISVNICKPEVTKGNHWHHTKHERFIAVQGQGLIRLRRYGGERVIEYRVDAQRLQSVDMPCGYVHSITNTGDEDLIILIWSNECFDPERADTYYEEV